MHSSGKLLEGRRGLLREHGTAQRAPAFDAPVTNPFGCRTSEAVTAPTSPTSTRDGDLDAFIGEQATATRSSSENTGTAAHPPSRRRGQSLRPRPNVGVDSAPSGCADIDGDGDLDAFVGDNYGRSFFFENRSLGLDTCTDGIDNDLDGAIDLGADLGCVSADDPDENARTVAICRT